MANLKSLALKLIGIASKVLFGQSKDTILYYPDFSDLDELAHHYHAAKYFLPLDEAHRVSFLVSDSLAEVIEKEGGIPLPDYFDENLVPDKGPGKCEPDLIFCESEATISRILKPAPSTVLLWKDVPKVKQKPWSLVINQATFVVSVDRYAPLDCFSYPQLRYMVSDKETIIASRENEHKRLFDYVKSLSRRDTAYVFGTGPSVETAYDYDFSDGYRIICNTLVKNGRLLEYIKPHFIVAADGIYHFGISKYPAAFRRDLERVLSKHNCKFIMPEPFYANFIFHYPHLKESTIAVPYTSSSVNIDMLNDFSTFPAMNNVLTLLLLPLASSLAKDIRLLGFDGRKPNDEHFWQSSNAINYEDLKIYQQQAHPGFFNGVNFKQYATNHGDEAEQIIAKGESVGKRYYSLNESTNSALAKRFLKTQEP